MEEKNPGFLGSCAPCDPLTCSPCCGKERYTVKLQGDQPVVQVPVYQEILRRDKYVEVPQVSLHDSLVPKVYTQETIHDVPKLDVNYREKAVEVESNRFIDKTVSVPIHMGYAPKFVPTWDIREVPRPVAKYEGEQKVIEVAVPQVKYVDKIVEKEVVVEVKEKIVPKITEVEKPVEVVKYQWKEQFEDVPVYKYIPKFDVELECPPPLILPYAETKVVRDPPLQQEINCYNSYLSRNNYCCYPCDDAASRMENAGSYAGHQPLTQEMASYMDASQFEIPEGVPIYPMTSPKNDPSLYADFSNKESSLPQASEASKKKGWFFWPFCKEEPSECCKLVPENSAYPEGMPSDFKQYFQEALDKQNAERIKHIQSSQGKSDANDLEPTVEYKGSLKKDSVFGGNLDSISFKLHAVEIHQFITLPNLEVPQFIQTLPDIDVSTRRSEIESFFGPVPAGWADPGVTGMPAPMMSDIIQGNFKSEPSMNIPNKDFISETAEIDSRIEENEEIPQVLAEARG
ncbi:alveolin domain containing intermediate filament IMC13 [Cardiosporidium cionae]|uniref:Alveolin domain containing intermediate filament IMC13 n=1 Tax=Cardiosporidium cionae TaxID=476202 RepID=A0ABQ7JA24_9APIC|nr:alveolin domain containing intermediate filament IMC13 [Cardiosporidium cionae]|eukprot:KAF8820819.1 alveolin domain containing intermediate filament IMC13 [Cardiosporidium cionae]